MAMPYFATEITELLEKILNLSAVSRHERCALRGKLPDDLLLKSGKAQMLTQKSPSGAMFPYYYKNGELFGMHLGSYFSDEEGVITMMEAEAEFSARQHRRLGLWIDFYETRLTDRVIQEFVEMLKQMRPRITKLAIVGAPFSARWKINRLIKKTDTLVSLPVKYYEDPEEAKTWLVSELE